MKKRETNFELLRILAMCMIVGLHYLDKGNVLGNFLEADGVKGNLPWIFEAFFFSAVNVYVLISGYFLVEKEVHIKKVFSLWGQVWFYSLILGLVALLTGVLDLEQMDIYRAVYYVFPVVTEHYWFVTSYILLYLLLPFLNPALQKMEQKKMRNLLVLFLILCSVSKTVLPVSLAVDKKGYDVLWFFCLYLTGAYYKRFGFAYLRTKGRAILLYVLSSFGMFGCSFILKTIFQKTGHLQNIVTYAYSYNHLLCYLAAVGLFVCFACIKIRGEKVKTVIGIFGGATFGVYLLHEHIDFRYRWPIWLAVEKQADSVWFPVLMLGSILLVFAACAVLELVRQKVFDKWRRAWKTENLEED